MADPKDRGKFILVIDNSVDDRFALSMLLQQFGYNICTAATADEAVEFLCVAPPVAIIADLGAGWQPFAAKYRKDGRFSDIPLIVMSAFPDRLLKEQAATGAVAALVKKPLDVEEFYRAVQATIEKSPRKHIRIATYLRARLEDEQGGGEGAATVLSEFGMFFRTLDPRPVHTRLPVSIEIGDRTVHAEAEVLYGFSFDEGPFKDPGMGMKFVKIDPAAQAFVRSYILEQVKQGASGK